MNRELTEKEIAELAIKCIEKNWDYEALKYGDDLYGIEHYASQVWEYVEECKEIVQKLNGSISLNSEETKVFIKVDPNQKLPNVSDDYITNKGDLYYDSESNKWFDANYTYMADDIEFYFQEISLTELMVGFAEWVKKEELKAYRKGIKPTELEELLEVYLQSKGVVL